MPALNFQKRFVWAVESGIKRQTIRPIRKRSIKIGDMLYLYTGMRTKACRKLDEAKCISIKPFNMGMLPFGHRTELVCVTIGNKMLSSSEIRHLAQVDGFSNADEMINWFQKTHSLPFEGQLIRW